MYILLNKNNKQKKNHLKDLFFGLLDISCLMFFFFPFFGEKSEGIIKEVSLLGLTNVSGYLKILYFAVVIGIVFTGVLTLALQNFSFDFWKNNKNKISLIFNSFAVVLFIISLQPYAATFLFVFLVIKALMLIKKP